MTTPVQLTHRKARKLTLQLASGQVSDIALTAIGDPATGTVKVGPCLSTGLFLGVFGQKVDATSGQLPVEVDFLQELEILYRANDGSATASSIFNKCYAVDDRTASTSTGGGSRALLGTILVVDAIDGIGFAVGRPFLENT